MAYLNAYLSYTFVIIDSTNDKEETVEVGVIVMGLCCICLVACALVVLQLRSNNRRISGNRHRSGPSDGLTGDRSRDPLDVEAPPSYDAGMMVNNIFLMITATMFKMSTPPFLYECLYFSLCKTVRRTSRRQLSDFYYSIKERLRPSENRKSEF